MLGLEPRRKTGWVTWTLRSHELGSLWKEPNLAFSLLCLGVTFFVPYSRKDNKGLLYQRRGLWSKGSIAKVDNRCLWQKPTQKYTEMSEFWKILVCFHPLTCSRINNKYICSIGYVLVHLTSTLSTFLLLLDKRHIYCGFTFFSQLEF